LAATLLSQQAQASVWTVDFSGAGISGSMTLTVAPDVSPPDPNPACGTAGQNPCRSDPAGAYMITGIAGCSATIWMEGASIKMDSATTLDGMIVAVD
jgi:hypothetical protein